MQIVFYSKHNPDGHMADWPVVPRAGERIGFVHPTGYSIQVVQGVNYRASDDGSLLSVSVHLENVPAHEIVNTVPGF